MNILGFNAFQHDSAAALVQDGKLIAASAEERFSRKKHDGELPVNAIDFCLSRGNINIEDIDYVAFYWQPYRGIINRAMHILKNFPQSLSMFKYRGVRWKKLRKIKQIFTDKYGISKYKFICVEHHLAHMASAYYQSGFDESAILIIDGAGEWATTTLGIGTGSNISKLKSINFPNSLGNLYSAITQYLGFKPHNGEGKVMGLAPYGDPAKYREIFKDILSIGDKGEYRLNLKYFGHHLGQEIRYSDYLVKKLGDPRKPESELEQRHMDIAASLQETLEQCAVSIASHLHDITNLKNICIAGGVGLNCVMNTKIFTDTKFDRIYIHPPAADDGSSIGAALFVWHCLLNEEKKYAQTNMYLGPEYSNSDIEERLKKTGISYTKKENIEQTAAQLLADGKIIGWFQGRSEFGPRALGNRSIVTTTAIKEMKDILNERVKHREGFRPFAPSVLDEKSGDYFKDFGHPSPYMILAWDVIEEKKDVIPAIVHVDGTARVQNVYKHENPRYYKLIEEFGKITGIYVILNTSFNVRGEPIVNTPEQAVDCFINTGMDYLAIGDFLISK